MVITHTLNRRDCFGSLLAIVLLMVVTSSLSAQIADTSMNLVNTTDQDRSIRITLTPGLTARITPGFEPDSTVDSKTGGPGGILRIMLVPEHALSVGIESGAISITNVKENPGLGNSAVPEKVILTAIPIFLTAAMGNEQFEIGGGIGYYSLIATGDAPNAVQSFKSHDWEIGFMLNAGYWFKLGTNYKLGPSLRMYTFTDRPITLLMLGLGLEMRAFEL